MKKLFIIIIFHLYIIMDNKAILCDCEYSSEYIIISEKCNHCTEREKKPWYTEVKKIGKYLRLIENTSDIPKNLIIHRNLFEYLLTCNNFMAKNSNFRKMVISKIDEYKLDDRCKCLDDIFDKFNIFLDNLVSIDGYVE